VKQSAEGPVPNFVPHIASGRLLEQVAIAQNTRIRLPIFIPTNTHDFRSRGFTLPLNWVAADIRMIFNVRKLEAAAIKPDFATVESTRKYLRVDDTCNLLVVLNGKDKFLESFWAMDRQEAFHQLRKVGFSIGTAATYSIFDRTTHNTPTPYAHHAVMLMRHNQVLYELQQAGLCAIPNLYWNENDQRETKRWGEWLSANSQVHFVSRDFTMNGHPKTMISKLDTLIRLFDTVGRSFHVLVVGTGPANAPVIVRKLGEAGHSSSIITSSPIMDAQSNNRYRISADNRIIEEKPADRSMPFDELIWHNLQLFEHALLQSVKGTEVEHRSLLNLRPVLDSGTILAH
jgi:hypothetical protein